MKPYQRIQRLLPMDNYVDKAFYDIADSWKDVIAGSDCLIAKNEQDMLVVKERNPIWYESITSAGGKNIVLYPLRFGEELLGYIWAINFLAENAIKIKETLVVTTFIVGSEIYNMLLMEKLKKLSSVDMLTTVMNRNEMNNFIYDICKEKNAANILKSVFDVTDIFRAGGDEFTIICIGVTEEELAKKVEQIRTAEKDYENVSFALGMCYVDDKTNIKTALRLADERMYEDKRLYYEKRGKELNIDHAKGIR